MSQLGNLLKYDHIQISYKKDDNEYIIKYLGGIIAYKDNFEKCRFKQETIVNEVKKIFKNPIISYKEKKHRQDKTGKSKIYSNYINIDGSENGDRISIQCYDWSKESVIYPFSGVFTRASYIGEAKMSLFNRFISHLRTLYNDTVFRTGKSSLFLCYPND